MFAWLCLLFFFDIPKKYTCYFVWNRIFTFFFLEFLAEVLLFLIILLLFRKPRSAEIHEFSSVKSTSKFCFHSTVSLYIFVMFATQKVLPVIVIGFCCLTDYWTSLVCYCSIVRSLKHNDSFISQLVIGQRKSDGDKVWFFKNLTGIGMQ